MMNIKLTEKNTETWSKYFLQIIDNKIKYNLTIIDKLSQIL